MKEVRFRLGRIFFPVRVVRHWKTLPREPIGSPSLKVFRGRLHATLSTGPVEGVPACVTEAGTRLCLQSKLLYDSLKKCILNLIILCSLSVSAGCVQSVRHHLLQVNLRV